MPGRQRSDCVTACRNSERRISVLGENPISPLKTIRERAVGFFHERWKRIITRGALLKPKQESTVVAVDLGQSHILVLSLDKRFGKKEISHFRLEARPDNPADVSQRLRGIFKEEGLKAEDVRIALKGQGVVIRILSFPQMKKEDFASSLQYEAEKYIPFRANEVVIDFQILQNNISRGNAQMMDILLVAVKQTEIQQCLQLFQAATLQVGVIDISAFALANLVEYLYPEIKDRTVGFLDVGAETSTFGVLSKGDPVFIRDISFGGLDILKLIKRKLGMEENEIISMQKKSTKFSPDVQALIEQGLASFLTELELSLGYYENHVTGAGRLSGLYIAGGGSRFILQSTFLENEIKIPMIHPEIFTRIGVREGLDMSILKENSDLLPVALGLCLRP